MNKEALRKIYKKERLNLSAEDCTLMQSKMMALFKQLPLALHKNWVSYQAITAFNEINNHLIEEIIFHHFFSAKLGYPKADFSTCEMEVYEVNSQLVWEESKGIKQPKSGTIISASEIDYVIVPMLIFDTNGYRVGYGKGFYDRYLAKCHPEVVKIGFSYFPPIHQIDDVNTFDIPLNYCVTPNTVYEF